MADFASEVFEYWIPRLVADGVDPNDAAEVRARVAGWKDWPGAWAAQAEAHLALAEERLAGGHTVTAGEALVRASLCFHFAQVIAFDDPAEKAALQARKLEAYRRAAPYLVPPALRLTVPFEGLELPGYLRLPAAAEGPVPCVVLVPGLDSTKEDFDTIATMCVRRGMAAFAFDGPGQGEVWPAAKLTDAYAACIPPVVAAMAARPGIDPERIALLGRSLGGHYVVRASAACRVAATVVFGGCYDLSDWDTMPASIRGGFRHATGAGSEEAAHAIIGGATVDGMADRVRCPVLVVHGKRDAIFSWRQAARLADILPDAALAMDEDGVHCCHNHAFRYRTAMADWLAGRLLAR